MYQTEFSSGSVNNEFSAIASPIGEVLRRFMDFYHAHPQIETRIRRLQDRHALMKKAQRIRDAYEVAQQTRELMDEVAASCAPELHLRDGRPRMHPHNVFLFAMIRFAAGAPGSRVGITLAMESMSVRALLHPSTKAFPGATTILENINLIDERTLRRWLRLQLLWIRAVEGSDAGWQQVTVDSTAIGSAATFPVDSALLVDAVENLWQGFEGFYRALGIALPKLPKVQRWRKHLHGTHKAINMGLRRQGAARKRRQWYRQMIEQAILLITNVLNVHEALMGDQLDARKRLYGKALRLVDRFNQQWRDGISTCVQVMRQIQDRVFKGERIAALEKLLSHSDGDAAIIVKGGREAVFGYKVQFAFNQPGYCTAVLVNEGNASDTTSLEPVIRMQNRTSGIAARQLSVDDGYAGRQTAEQMSATGVEQFSVSGSKGKRQLGEETWNDEIIRTLRMWRSAAESRIFTFKHNQQGRRLSRYGRTAATEEIVGKILVFNMDCLLRRQNARRWGHADEAV